MATLDGTVKKSRVETQKDLQKHKEHCSADALALDALGITVCQQVRVKRDNGKYALYTVSELRHETPADDKVVRMGETGRKRLLKDHEADNDFSAEFDFQVVNPTINDHDVLNGEFIERLRDDDNTQTGLIVLAPHGGGIEDHTDDQATRVADQLASKPVSLWLCKGYAPQSSATDASQIWHITAADIHPGSFPGLNSVFPGGSGTPSHSTVSRMMRTGMMPLFSSAAGWRRATCRRTSYARSSRKSVRTSRYGLLVRAIVSTATTVPTS